MGYDLEKLYEGPRFEKRQKRRKINRVLNVLIGLVVVLILFFGGKLIFGGDESAKPENIETGKEQVQGTKKGEDKDSTTGASESEKEDTSKTEDNKQEETTDTADDTNSDKDDQEKVTEGDPESNIIRTIENQSWKPVGTEQAEPHVINYEAGSTDRLEMEKAVSYATGIDTANMTVWWLGREAENKVAATIASKDNQKIYRVYIEWIANEGWKPLKVEQLKENDSPAYKEQNETTSEDDSEDSDD